MKAELYSCVPIDSGTRDQAATLASELRRLAASFEIRSSASFSVFGHAYEAAPSDTVENDRDSRRLTTRACDLLADVLYMTMHCRRTVPASSGVIIPRPGDVDSPSFVARLSTANTGSGSWHDGWTLRAQTGQQVLGLERGELRLWAHRMDFVPDNGHFDVGAIGRLRFPKEYLNLYPGYYVALGNAHRGRRDDGLRLYWNVTADGAARLLARLSHALNEAAIDFQLKVLNTPQQFDRTDAAILYVPKKDWAAIRELVAAAYEELKGWLKPAVSAYVLGLAPGLGLAEDPVEHVSFGQHRSRILASSLSAASERKDAFTAVLSGVQAAGLDVRRFYLNAGSSCDYSL